MKLDAPRILISAPFSGCGKTTVCMAILRALQLLGKKPVAMKCGPDYIDPMFHRRVIGAPVCNLDLFLSGEDYALSVLTHYLSKNGDIAVIEGAMGYYDGIAEGENASAYHVAAVTETPVILVISSRGAALSLAAVLKGFNELRKPSGIAGFILNGCTKERYQRLAPVLQRESGLLPLGFLPHIKESEIKSRHLGLVAADEVEGLAKKVEALANAALQGLDFEKLLEIAYGAPALQEAQRRVKAEFEVTVAVARDEAFSFYYDESLLILEKFGAKLLYFSPLHDKAIPKASALYLGGGYPELYARELSENHDMLKSVRAALKAGMPCIAECGGYMYLGSFIEGENKNKYPMCDVLPTGFCKDDGPRRFGYCTIYANKDSLLLKTGESMRVHEFHHWSAENGGEAFLVKKPDGRSWSAGYCSESLYAGFGHIYFYAQDNAVKRFLSCAENWRHKNEF